MCGVLLARGADARAVTRAGAAPLDEARRGAAPGATTGEGGGGCAARGAVVALLEAAMGEGGSDR